MASNRLLSSTLFLFSTTTAISANADKLGQMDRLYPINTAEINACFTLADATVALLKENTNVAPKHREQWITTIEASTLAAKQSLAQLQTSTDSKTMEALEVNFRRLIVPMDLINALLDLYTAKLLTPEMITTITGDSSMQVVSRYILMDYVGRLHEPLYDSVQHRRRYISSVEAANRLSAVGAAVGTILSFLGK
jgi:hypothetical protein